jgi:prepilin-type N-terminal cleavage/methylation domain-containing protein
MRTTSKSKRRGFSLLEMMIALALGMIVLGAAVSMYTRGVNATFIVSQRAEMQQDYRAASNMLVKDIGLAGAGLENAAIALPSGTGTLPIYGCDAATGCHINGGAVAFPQQGGIPYLYGLIPGNKLGPTLNAAQGPTDIVTVAYIDTNFLLNCYKVSFNATGTVATFVQPPAPLPGQAPLCVLPPGLAAPQPINDPVVGLTPGDIVWFQVTLAGGGSATGSAAGVVTNVAVGPNVNGAPSYNVSFAAGDPMKINQPGAPAGSLAQIASGTGTGTRLMLVTYYIDTTACSNNTPCLVRRVSGHPAVPVAENVVYLKLTYDLYNNGATLVAQDDGGASQGLSPNQITKVTIQHMSIRSQMKGTKGYQSFDLQTSVSARDLTFKNQYPLN